MLYDWLIQTWVVIALSSDWLLVGFFLAGVIHVLLPSDFVYRHLKEPGLRSVLKASLVGVPLPLCSCSVIPVGVSLRKQGASRGATASFFVSTPEIGVDSFLISYALLGPLTAVLRVAGAFFSAVLVGIGIDSSSQEELVADSEVQSEASSCCAEAESETLAARMKTAVRYGYVNIVDDLATLLVFGFFLAGFVAVVIPDTIFLELGRSPWGAMLAMLVVSLPVYVCATSSTPLAAVLLAKGLNPSAVLVFLLAGPATNLTTMLALRRELGSRALVIYIAGVVLVAIAIGVAADSLISHKSGSGAMGELLSHESHVGFSASAVVLCMLLFSGLWRNSKK